MAAEATPAGQPHPHLDAIQGNLVGFNKDLQRLVFVHFGDQATGKAFLTDLSRDVASGREVKAFNDLFKEITRRRGAELGIIEASWTNVALSHSGLAAVGAAGLETFPAEFTQTMAAQAPALGDAGASAPSTWKAPFDRPEQVHAMVILAADTTAGLGGAYERLQAKLSAHGATELGREDGRTRAGARRGHEHFGFKDGISQPSIAGITRSSKGGPDVAAGEFVIGYLDQDGHVSGEPAAPSPAPSPGDPGYPGPAPAPPPAAMPGWTKDGSFVVYRRLRQDVGAFNDFVTQQAAQLGVDPEQLAAKLVGRWRSGAPMEHVPGLSNNVDPSASDPSAQHPEVLNDAHINHFGYQNDDADGHRVPRAAHIRKTNPRDEDPPTEQESNRHRILRRGIPYGPDFQPGENAYGTTVPDTQDRGLLFLCYQASIARGFAFVQQSWANAPDFPQAGDRRDPIISQDADPHDFSLPPQNVHLAMRTWVLTTAGEYFFSPSIPALAELCA